MFDHSTPRVLLGGRSGPIPISQFIDIFDRNKAVDNANWRRERTDKALAHLCTLTIGNPNLGDARNVPAPMVPEFTDSMPNGWIIARGWRHLMMLFVQDGWMYPTREVESWLGSPMLDYARMSPTCKK